jgi:periplasmic protein TonB
MALPSSPASRRGFEIGSTMTATTTSPIPPLALAAAAGLHVLVGIAVLDLWQRSSAFDERRPVEIEIVTPAAPPEPEPEPTAEPVAAVAEPEVAALDPAFIPEPEPPPPLVFEPPKPPPPKPASRPVTRPAPAVPTAPATPVAAAPAAPRHDPSYLDRLAAAIERERDYPLHSRRQGHQGRVVIHLVIAASGKLLAAQVVTGSGLDTLDQAALGMVRRARLPPLTPGLGAESAIFTIPIVFAIR